MSGVDLARALGLWQIPEKLVFRSTLYVSVYIGLHSGVPFYGDVSFKQPAVSYPLESGEREEGRVCGLNI